MAEERRYWSHRRGYREPLTGEFWTAFAELLRRLVAVLSDRDPEEKFLGELVYLDRYGDWEDFQLRRAIRERIGRDYCTPFDVHRRPNSEEQVLDTIEILYDLTAEIWKVDYTDNVNDLLKRLNQPYQLVAGEIHYHASEVLDAPVESLDGVNVRDETLRAYLEHARGAFFDARKDRRLEGLRAVYDAFERIKTLHGEDKKESASRTAAELARFEELQPHFENLFRTYTAIGNTANIRHSERDKVVLDEDGVLVEHLFYSVWALVRGVLSRESGEGHREERV